jgi:hypothetical protein
MMVLYASIKRRAREPVSSFSRRLAKIPGLFAQEWIGVIVNKMYIHFDILICIELNPIKDLELY